MTVRADGSKEFVAMPLPAKVDDLAPNGCVVEGPPLKALRYLAFLVQDYFTANPAVDSGHVDVGGLDLAAVQDQILACLKDQGIEPSAFDPDPR